MDGEEAITKLRGKRFALLVMDWKLPVMGEGELLRAVRAMGIRLPVVVMSGLEREEIGVNLEGFGASFINKKELSPGMLYQAISNSLRLLGFAMSSVSMQSFPMRPQV